MELPEEEAEWPLYQHVNATCLVAHHTIFEPPHMRLADCSNRGRIAATPTTFGPEVGFEDVTGDLLEPRFWPTSGLPTTQPKSLNK